MSGWQFVVEDTLGVALVASGTSPRAFCSAILSYPHSAVRQNPGPPFLHRLKLGTITVIYRIYSTFSSLWNATARPHLPETGLSGCISRWSAARLLVQKHYTNL